MAKFKFAPIFFLSLSLVSLSASLVANVQEMEPRQLQSFMRKHPGTQLIDVREGWERRRSKIPKSQSIPMGDITTAIEKLSMEKPVIAFCKTGQRSRHAAEILEKIGFREVYTLRGGIEAYWVEVDTALPRY